jgi:hypothetical protein
MQDHPQIPPLIERHMSVFMPYALRRVKAVGSAGTRFAYYTDADTAMKILDTGTIWMRQAACMNDYMEVQHGIDCLVAAWNGDDGKRLKDSLEKRFQGIVQEVADWFNGWQHDLRFRTFVTCFSEHAGPGHENEDHLGRLSMWRAYGRGAGVALIIKQDPFWSTDTSLGLYTSPIAYLDDKGFAAEFKGLVDSIEANASYLDEIKHEGVRNALEVALSAAVVSVKHPGFHEEREWRIVRTPNSPFRCPLQTVSRTIGGIPQPVLLLDLKDRPPGLVGITPPALIDRVIIGPTVFPLAIKEALLTQMEAANIPDAKDKLHISFVPLRA